MHDVDLLHLDGDVLEFEVQLAKEVVSSLRTQENRTWLISETDTLTCVHNMCFHRC